MTALTLARRPLASVVALVLAADVGAAEIGGDLSALVQASDNARKTATKPISDTFVDTRAGLRLEDRRPWLDASLDYVASHKRYDKESYADKTRVQGQGELAVTLWPQRLKWLLRHQQELHNVDPGASETPDNETTRRTWATGPELLWRLSARDSLTINLTRAETRFDLADIVESDREQAVLYWQHALSEKTNWLVFGQYADIDFDQALSGYRQQQWQLGLSGLLRGGDYVFRLGQGRVELAAQALTGLEYYLEGRYRHGPYEWQLQAARELTDTNSSSPQQAGLRPQGSYFDNLAIAWRSRAELNLSRSWPAQRLSSGLTLFYDDNQPEVALQGPARSVRQYGLGLDVQYQFNDRFLGQLQLHSREFRFDRGREQRLDRLYLGLEFRVTEAVDIRGWSQFSNQQATELLREYDEWLLAIGVSYRF